MLLEHHSLTATYPLHLCTLTFTLGAYLYALSTFGFNAAYVIRCVGLIGAMRMRAAWGARCEAYGTEEVLRRVRYARLHIAFRLAVCAAFAFYAPLLDSCIVLHTDPAHRELGTARRRPRTLALARKPRTRPRHLPRPSLIPARAPRPRRPLSHRLPVPLAQPRR